MKILLILLILLAIALAAVMIWARGVSPDPERLSRPETMPAMGDHPESGGFTAVRAAPDGTLERLDAIARATPRTERVAGGPETGHTAYVTRTAVMGFPDVTHIWREGDRIAVSAHLVVGGSDMGVNRRRVEDWLSQAGIE